MIILGYFYKDEKKIKYFEISSKLKVKKIENEKEESKFLVKENPKFLNYFYNFQENEIKPISDARVFIGENGAGKTFIVKKIIKKITDDFNSISVLFFDEILNEYFISKKDEFVLEGINIKEKNIEFNTIFYSNAVEYSFSNSLDIKKDSFYDLSNTKYLSMLTSNNDFKTLVDKDILNQINLILDNIENRKFIDELSNNDILPQKIVFDNFGKLKFLSDRDTAENKSFTPEINQLCHNIFREKTGELGEILEGSLLYNSNRHFLTTLFYQYRSERMDESEIDNFNITDEFTLLKRYVVNKKNEHQNELIIKKYNELLPAYEQLISAFENSIFFSLNAKSNSILVDDILSSDKAQIDILLEIMRQVYSVNDFGIKDSIYAKWESISSGQACFLNLFGRLNSLKIGMNYSLLIIDEVDLGLHPVWQKNWLDIIINIFSELYKKNIFQLILTTHSPIMLSNFRKQDVSVIDKNQTENIKSYNSNIFSGNINLLLDESFEVKQGVSGTFSQKKIKEIITNIKKGILIEENKVIIDEIGEPILKNNLLRIFEDLQGKKEKNNKNENNIVHTEIQEFINVLRGLKDEKN